MHGHGLHPQSPLLVLRYRLPLSPTTRRCASPASPSLPVPPRQCTGRVLGRAHINRRLISTAFQNGNQGIREAVERKVKANKNDTEVVVGRSRTSPKRFKWTKERTKFLTSYLIEQASDAQGKDALFREDTLRQAAEAASQRFQRECGITDVLRRLATLSEKWRRIEKMKALGSATWDHATRTVSMRESKDHPKDSGLLNSPIEDYDELSFIFSDDYDVSASKIPSKMSQNADSIGSKISEDLMEQKIASEDIHYLVLKIGELVDTIKSLKPRDFSDDLWKAVTACGYNDRMSITAFEYFLKNEVEGKIFLVRSPDLRKE